MQSKMTSVMTTPKHPGVQIWQIYPLQVSIDALNTITPNLADLSPIEHRCIAYHYTKLGRSTSRSTPPIKHRCLEYHYTKLGRSAGKSTPQSSIDALHTLHQTWLIYQQISPQDLPGHMNDNFTFLL